MEKVKQVAICGSFECTGIQVHYLKNKNFVIKDVPRGTCSCPDCRHALRWVKENNWRNKTVTRPNQQKYGREKDYNLNGV